MTVQELLVSFPYTKAWVQNWGERVVGIAHDSRSVRQGYAFFALVGSSHDGHAFLGEALSRGARLLVVEREESVLPFGNRISWVVTPSTRRALALASCAFFGHPSRHMYVVGVTGTNGKTTTCFLLQSIFEHAGYPCGLLTTARNIVGPFEWESPNTTMESLFLAQSLRMMQDLGIHHAVLEVSSHGLALGRVEGILFDAAVFTNIVPEHLEFHKTFAHYFESKRKLATMVAANLTKAYPRMLVVNGEDESVLAIARLSGLPFLRFGYTKECEVQAGNVRWSDTSTVFEARTP
ncbi:MAG: Mur ligase family protein, partial [Atribacterota bacterium]